MTVLDSRSDVPRDGGAAAAANGAGVLITDKGVSMPSVDDIGAGRGPAWLDDWLTLNAPDVIAWYRHIHANPELSRREYNTTELVAGLLAAAGLHPKVFDTGTGLI
ncbi:MAG: amidohydrolase, partial [Actinomycetota bacterium]|nr:amidohydrolase [Actinomycetota bacterium]